ncbi:YciI family protein [Demequina sp.]|uniref:YciI family protein n=1 Tax=Demequina sp. TaxID=2050685 RepID=UPI0025CE2F9B|nr:YciI family protein [Demequina sp.]
MSLFAVHYSYDDRAEDREAARPEHRAYFEALAREGKAVAFGRFEDHLSPGALIILDVDTREEAEAIVAADPFVRAGLVPGAFVRTWPAGGPWAR